MIPIITINGQQLTVAQVKLLRALLIQYATECSEMIWRYMRANDPSMASIPAQRTLSFELLEIIDCTGPAYSHFPEDPVGTYVTVNGGGLDLAYGEIVRMVLSSNAIDSLQGGQGEDRNIMLKAVWLKVS